MTFMNRCPTRHRATCVSTPRRAFTLIELLIVTAIIGVLSAIAVPNLLQARLRAQIAKTNGDMDAVAKAVMMFRLDQNHFPPATDNIGETYVSGTVDFTYIEEFVTFQTSKAGRFVAHLTSPVAYISHAPLDPFSANPVLPYGYAGGRIGYIITSFGPDRDQEEGISDLNHRGDIDEPTAFILAEGEKTEYSLMSSFLGTHTRQKSPSLLRNYLNAKSYDPSNGLLSNGDLWRGSH